MSAEGGANKERSERVAERLRVEIADVLLRGQLHGEAAQGLYVSAVRVSKDLRHARVYVRLTESSEETQRQAALRALERGSGFLRRTIGPRLKLRYVPELRFFWDETADTAARIEAILAQERREGDPS